MLGPSALADPPVDRGEAAAEGDHQPEGQLDHGGHRGSGCVGHDDAADRGRLEVDAGHARAGHRDEPEAGKLQKPLGSEGGPLPDGDHDLGRAQPLDQLAFVPRRVGVNLDLAVGEEALHVRASQVRLVVIVRNDEVHPIRGSSPSGAFRSGRIEALIAGIVSETIGRSAL